ncbi:dehydrogenase [Rhizobium sp. Leaf384]|uniref:zinc-dependent alcohol dehydrogenase n=1 Tax=unclassified Rhizobium TaxID=2613769 RepID=UPI000713D6C1|nr:MULTISPECIES: zinc-binding alcohol dehydrogenase [unclassified Rhizobium]KQS74393.1 dehydrogenase [Rhizobium sp. Leaf383]KQS80132.1 dehydrogenase [Rhizobium sp. Leaf384]
MTNPTQPKDVPASRPAARALWFPERGACHIREEALPDLGSDDVLVRSLYSGISRGTEATVFQGLVPRSEYDRMRAPFMAGDFPFPVKYGYCSVGEVIEGGTMHRGTRVFCLYPHQDCFIVPQTALVLLPPDLSPGRAVLAANMETALNILWDAEVRPGDRVAVFGAGVVGALTAYLATGIPGTETQLIDTNPERAALAERLGLSFAPPDALKGEYDVLINASGRPEALSSAIDHAGLEGRIVEASWYGERQATLSLGGAFHSRRLSIKSSQVGHVPASQQARWPLARRLAKALDLLGDPRLDALISGETAFPDLPDHYPRILQATSTLCHRVRY